MVRISYICIMKDKILELRLQGKSYKEIERELGCARSTIAFHCQRHGLNKPVRDNHPKGKNAVRKIKEIKLCENCGKEILNKENKKVCSLKCSGELTGKNKYNKFILDWKNGNVSGGRGDSSGHGCVSGHVRKYLFKKYDNKCAECNWSEVNPYTQTIPLEVEHVDGNSLNHKEENLILLCPNCHSLKAGHSTSKGNGRRYYREKYHKEKRDSNP